MIPFPAIERENIRWRAFSEKFSSGETERRRDGETERRRKRLLRKALTELDTYMYTW